MIRDKYKIYIDDALVLTVIGNRKDLEFKIEGALKEKLRGHAVDVVATMDDDMLTIRDITSDEGERANG